MLWRVKTLDVKKGGGGGGGRGGERGIEEVMMNHDALCVWERWE